ncbi:NACHT domain-containing protein [Lasiosphaeris hirsuta]|uniref:NACHT domain-containing protein n=1 Tax=Lasiosphaeris hirsuta TaxID=260670 RepID=A0AA40ARR0_9PEZI|nr:NACHT domain-containing protein [Lasiosphaeris hirsuta]
MARSPRKFSKGDPGKGRTMLLCGIVDELSKSIPLSFFFCQATDSSINNATAVLRGLIYLLVDQQAHLLSHVRSKYDRADETVFKDANAWDTLLEIFTNILQDPSLKTTYLVIDALDECVTGLPELLGLIAPKSSVSPHVKWIVSSRNWPQIEERLETAAEKTRLSLEMNAESITTAVEAYFRHQALYLKRLKGYDRPTENAIQKYLSSNANGTFLWVALVCQALAGLKVRTRHILAKLRTFPPGLDSLYTQMMEHIHGSEDADRCRHILAVATIVRRPISLQELISLVKVLDDICDDLESLGEIIGLGSFLTLRERTVYFVHQSAKDYLLRKGSDKTSNEPSRKAFNWVFPSGVEEVNCSIFSRSLDIMSSTLRRDVYNLSAPGFPIENVRVPDPDPLSIARYSCVYRVDHLYNSVSGKSTIQVTPGDCRTIDAFL